MWRAICEPRSSGNIWCEMHLGWHLIVVDDKLLKFNAASRLPHTPNAMPPSVPHKPRLHLSDERGVRAAGWGGWSWASSRAKQELASKRLKAAGLIWGQTECIKRWLLLSVMTASCAPVFNYFSVMSLPTFHCSSKKTEWSRGRWTFEREKASTSYKQSDKLRLFPRFRIYI